MNKLPSGYRAKRKIGEPRYSAWLELDFLLRPLPYLGACSHAGYLLIMHNRELLALIKAQTQAVKANRHFTLLQKCYIHCRTVMFAHTIAVTFQLEHDQL